MGCRVRSRTRLPAWLALGGLFLACSPPVTVPEPVPDIRVRRDSGQWVESAGILFLDGSPFSGWCWDRGEAGDTLFLGAYREGRAEGPHHWWYPGGGLKESRDFRDGRQNGEVRRWYPDQSPEYAATCVDDHFEGLVRSWHENGQIHEQFHYRNGQEDGLQQRWDEHGKILANYVVRQGRRYGLSGRKDCISAADKLGPGLDGVLPDSL